MCQYSDTDLQVWRHRICRGGRSTRIRYTVACKKFCIQNFYTFKCKSSVSHSEAERTQYHPRVFIFLIGINGAIADKFNNPIIIITLKHIII